MDSHHRLEGRRRRSVIEASTWGPALLVLVIGLWFVLSRSYHALQDASVVSLSQTPSAPQAVPKMGVPGGSAAASSVDTSRLTEDVARLKAEVASRDRDITRLMALLVQRPALPPKPPGEGEDGHGAAEVAATNRARSFAASIVFGPRYAANPWRASLVRGRIDWHDLVPQPDGAAAPAAAAAPPPLSVEGLTPAAAAGAAAAAAKGAAAASSGLEAAAQLARHVREDAKTRLVALLQDRDPGPPHSPALAGARTATPQERLLGVLRGDALVADARTNAVSSNATVFEALLTLLRSRPAVERAAAVAGVGTDDLSGHYGPPAETGPLSPLAGCPLVRDKCLLHATLRACVAESLCGWCEARAVCVTRGMGAVQCVATPGAGAWGEGGAAGGAAGGEVGGAAGVARGEADKGKATGGGKDAAPLPPSLPPPPALVSGSRPGQLIVAADTVPPPSGVLPLGAFRVTPSGERTPVVRGNCSVLVWEHPLALGVAGDSVMAYHLATETLPQWYAAAKAAPGGVGGVSSLVLVKGAYHELFVFAHVFSGGCPRAAAALEVQRACFVPPGEGDAAAEASAGKDSAAGGTAPRGRPAPRGASALALALVDADSGAFVRALTPAEAAGVLEPPSVAVQKGMRLGLPAAKRVLEGIATLVAGSDSWLDTARLRYGDILPSALSTEDVRSAAGHAAGRIKLGSLADYSDLAIAHCMAHGSAAEAPSTAAADSPRRPLVVLVSRLNKRLVLNEPSLVRVALALGADVRVVALEGMGLCAQVQLFASAAVLVGMHGSALINAQFMARGTSLVQLVPHAVTGAAAFFRGPAEAHGVRYFELPAAPREASIPHGHFLKPSSDVEKVLAAGADAAGPQVFFSFLINQDTVVDEARFADVLARALKPPVRVLPSFPPPPLALSGRPPPGAARKP